MSVWCDAYKAKHYTGIGVVTELTGRSGKVTSTRTSTYPQASSSDLAEICAMYEVTSHLQATVDRLKYEEVRNVLVMNDAEGVVFLVNTYLQMNITNPHKHGPVHSVAALISGLVSSLRLSGICVTFEHRPRTKMKSAHVLARTNSTTWNAVFSGKKP
jgi:hypothetical protein